MEETEYVIQADKSGFKYAWVTEHHFLEEYSHLSANDVYLGYLAHATERIHLGSGIFNPLAQVNHPVKVAEKVAMLDHLTDGRFEFGTGRGAGSHEILGFLPGMTDMNHTKEIWEEIIGEFPKMWLQDKYEGFEGKYWSLPPRKILPKPYGKSAPGDVVRRRAPTSYAMAARKGLGVLGFSVQKVSDMEPVRRGVQDGDRERRAHRRVRERQRDGHDRRPSCAETHDEAVRIAVGGGLTTCSATSSATTTRSRTPMGARSGPSCSPSTTAELVELPHRARS